MRFERCDVFPSLVIPEQLKAPVYIDSIPPNAITTTLRQIIVQLFDLRNLTSLYLVNRNTACFLSVISVLRSFRAAQGPPPCFARSRTHTMTLSVCAYKGWLPLFGFTFAGCANIGDSSAKATDENLTAENWEYILVRYRSPILSSVLISCTLFLGDATDYITF